ncbi:NAD(P)/FAD-dependent oxidoreductase [Cytobacillus suaedae]|nr:NAD(P)/FAD-dependent oxidoreductase [Cytobacillus suaedae]
MVKTFDCIIIGGGFAGLQAAIQLGRYKHSILVIDSNHGRSTICKSYHNILGYPDGVSGETLRSIGKAQAESYGVEFVEDEVTDAKKNTNTFSLHAKSGEMYEANKILLATGVMDRIPDIPNIMPCLGLTIYVCPDCDGYEVKDKKVVLLGSGSTGANLALTLSYWTKQIVYINHDGRDLEEELKTNIQQKGITYIKQEIESVITGDKAHEFKGVKLKDGTIIEGDRGFIGFGGNKVKTDLAEKLGVERLENKHINVNPRTKETNIANVWAAGDILAHSEQVTIALGDGSHAAIWIHKRIMSEIN